MKKSLRCINHGFTLIELLVVVLIIGILSAVALPQYTKAVEKARVAEAKIVLKNMMDSIIRYGLVATPDLNILDSLDIELPGECSSRYCTTKNFEYYIDEFACGAGRGSNPGACAALHARRIGKDYEIRLEGPDYDSAVIDVFFCSGEDDVCKQAGATKDNDGAWFF